MADKKPAKPNGPEFVPQGASRSAHNSWAQLQGPTESTSLERGSPRPTNRDRYENKPMPELPAETPDRILTSRKPYIQPAIPIVDPVTQIKNRSATDPAGSTNLFGRRPSITQLRKKFGHSKSASQDDRDQAQSRAVPHPTSKAAAILGVAPEKLPGPTTTASKIPAEMMSDKNYVESAASADAQGKSDGSDRATPVPGRLHLRGDSQDSVCIDPASQNMPVQISAVAQAAFPKDQNPPKQDLGRLAPPKIASYGKIGEKGLIKDQGLFRVESVQGIIEHAGSPVRDATVSYHNEDVHESEPSRQEKKVTLPSISYIPSHYKGIWENDPAVISPGESSVVSHRLTTLEGYSLPPFSPAPQGQQTAYDKDKMVQFQNGMHGPVTPSVYRDDGEQSSAASRASATTTPSLRQEGVSSDTFHPTQTSQYANRHGPGLDDFRPNLGSANSWATNSKESSFTSENGLPSALLPPRWPHQLLTNAVPSPPQTRQDYERSGSLAAGLSHLDITVHHHIDTAFGSLSRQIEEQHDRTLDRVLRQLDSIEDSLGKTFKTIKSEIKSVTGELGRLKIAVSSFSSSNESVVEKLKGLEEKMEALEKVMEAKSRKPLDAMSVEPEAQDGRSNHQRKEKGELGRTASKSRPSKASNRSHRSNASNDRVSNGANVVRGVENEPFAAPDLRNHPAYAGIPHHQPQMYDQNGVPINMSYPAAMPYGPQHLMNGNWYHQAYGSG